MLPNKNNCYKVFAYKGYSADVYMWSPGCPNYTKKRLNGNVGAGNANPTFCNATAGSQGEDWTTTYVYDVEVVNYKQKRLAYVECDYVE